MLFSGAQDKKKYTSELHPAGIIPIRYLKSPMYVKGLIIVHTFNIFCLELNIIKLVTLTRGTNTIAHQGMKQIAPPSSFYGTKRCPKLK